MTRPLPLSLRRNIEANFSDEVNLIFLTIDHSTLAEPIRVVLDTKNYIYNGDLYIGFPFDITILSDDENPPTARLAIQNVDSEIGAAIRRLTSPPRLRIDLLHSDDFNITVSPRIAVASPAPDVITLGNHLFLVNVSVNAAEVTGDIKGWDYLQRVWPGRRAMQDTFPGLFR